jgi:uncharacterized OsmC-like protein
VDVETGTAVPLSAVSVRLTLRGHTLVQDKPEASGGKDKGPMASELVLAGLLACQHSTFVKIAAKRRTEARIRSLDGEMAFSDGDISALRVHFQVAAPPSVPDDAIATLLRLTDKSCTVSKALKIPVEARFTRVA